MIHVPELKTGETPFDPDFARIMTPPFHALAVQKTNNSPTGGINTGINTGATKKEQTPEKRIETILNLAVVKEAVTALHRAEDEEMKRLETISSSAICTITEEHEKFLRDQTNAGENACKNEQQKALFRKMTASFLAQSRMRAKAAQYQRTMEYWQKTVEEQNNEFLDRALRIENVISNEKVKVYHDLIIYNMENMLAALPDTEKRQKLNAAESAFYEKILEKRLECDPAGALALAEEKAEGKAEEKPEQTFALFIERAKKAIREQELNATAASWVEEKTAPEEAKAKAESRFADEQERKHVLERYAFARFEENKTLVSALVANIASAWERLKENEYNEKALPAWIARNAPALADCLRKCLIRRNDAGGGAGRINYAEFLSFLRRFEKEGAAGVMEFLRAEENCRILLLAAGGPESELWVLCVRFLGGVLREEDREYIEALRIAWGNKGQENKRQENEGQENESREQKFMERFAGEFRLLKPEERGGIGVTELVRRTAKSFPEVPETSEMVISNEE